MKILYKLSTAILALAIFPAVIFLPFFKLVVTSSVLSLFSSSSGETLINDTYSLKNLYDLWQPYKGNMEGISINSIPESIRSALGLPATFFIGFFILALLCALVIAFFGLFTKQKKAVVAFSGLGLAFTLGMNISFENLARPLVSGTISVTELLGDNLISALIGQEGILSSIITALTGSSANSLIDIRLLNLSATYIVMLLIFVAILVITVSSVLVEWD